jgi:hypothetical protein
MRILLIAIFCLVSFNLYAPPNLTIQRYQLHKINEWNRFKMDFAFKESSLNPDTINQCYKFGLYQFGNTALSDIDMDSITHKRFKIYRTKIFPVWLQDLAFKLYADKNWEYLGNYTKFVGKKKNGVLITKSGLVAACHLVGHSKVKLFLRKGIDSKDANGVKLTVYLKMFKGYNI